MSAVDDALRANAEYADGFAPLEDRAPRRRLTVLTCMDTRIDPLRALGLEAGDAHVLRNAGGLPTTDMLRSLAISQRLLGTEEVAVVLHTNCGMQDFDDEAFRRELAQETLQPVFWETPGFADVQAAARSAVETIRDFRWLPHRDRVRGFVFDVGTGALTEV